MIFQDLENIIFRAVKKVVREAGESHPPAECKLSLYSGSDLDEHINGLVDTTKSPKVNFTSNNDESELEVCDEDDLIKNISNNVSAVEKVGPPIGKYLDSIINNAMFNQFSREKLFQKLEKHPRPKN